MKVGENNSLEVLRSSDNRYKNLTVEIKHGWETIVQVNQDGKELEVEIFTDLAEDGNSVRMPLKDFEEALKLAAESLTK